MRGSAFGRRDRADVLRAEFPERGTDPEGMVVWRRARAFGRSLVAVACLAAVSGCVERRVPEPVPGLFEVRALADGCGVRSAVQQYHDGGLYQVVPARAPRSFDEYWVGSFAYDYDDPDRYEARDRNRLAQLLAFVLASEGFRVREGCSSRITLATPPLAGTDLLRFAAPDARTLCLITTEDDPYLPAVTVRSCTDAASDRNTFDVIFPQ